ncbi:MAG: hypothetical protein ACTSU2_01845 [Promethearchaeota archaeon]
MPLGILIIDFDEFEGAVTFFRYPPDFHIENEINYIQQIQISHNFISSIMIHQDEHINCISFYNDVHRKTIALFLSKYDDGQDFFEIIKQMDYVLTQNAEGKKFTSEEELFDELIRIFKLSFTIFNAKEEVFLKLANELSSIKSIEHDLRSRVNKLKDYVKVKKIKVLLELVLYETMKIDELIKDLNCNPNELGPILKELAEERLIRFIDDKTIQIYF